MAALEEVAQQSMWHKCCSRRDIEVIGEPRVTERGGRQWTLVCKWFLGKGCKLKCLHEAEPKQVMQMCDGGLMFFL